MCVGVCAYVSVCLGVFMYIVVSLGVGVIIGMRSYVVCMHRCLYRRVCRCA